MVPADYQEFANRRQARSRDNSVICLSCATHATRNQPSVARLSRRFKSTKAELSADDGGAAAPEFVQNGCLRADLRSGSLVTAIFTPFSPPVLRHVSQSPCRQCRSRGPSPRLRT